MRSHAVVIVRIVFQNPTQMFLVQDNDVVQTLAPDRSDQPFGKAVLPRRGRCNWLVSDAHGTQSARDDSAVDSISISDHIARSAIPRKSLGDLMSTPLKKCIGSPEQKYISDAGMKAPELGAFSSGFRLWRAYLPAGPLMPALRRPWPWWTSLS